MDLLPTTPGPVIAVRAYAAPDAAATLAIFLAAVTETAAADYTRAQVQAWARPETRDLPTWHAAMDARNSYVATLDGVPAGFSDVDPQGYVHMLFVSPRELRRGVARQLLRRVEAHARAAGLPALSAHVSITARPFFARHGFQVLAEQHPVMAGVQLTNFAMTKLLDP